MYEYDGHRQCASCGKVKARRKFWRNAKRCRRCVAREAGRERKKRTRDWHRNVRKLHGLRLSPPVGRYRRAVAESLKAAGEMIPRAESDRYAGLLSTAGAVLFLGMFGFGCAGVWVSLKLLWMVPVCLIISVLVIRWAEKLEQPRTDAVRELSERLLHEAAKKFEQEQLEYIRFYLTPEWKQVRMRILRRDGLVCQRCKSTNLPTYEYTVDHVKPRSRHPELALDPSNLQVLCRRCNSSKGARGP